MRKICFLLGKTEFLTHRLHTTEFLALGKTMTTYINYLMFYPNNMWNENTSSSYTSLHSTRISWCWRFHVLSCWRFFPCQLSHRYVMKMYCPSITILGYTSQSRKFEKLISIHLNKKSPIFRSSHQRCSIKAVPKNLAIFTTRKHLWWSLFLIKLQTLRPGTLLKRDSNTGVFLWILQNL